MYVFTSDNFDLKQIEGSGQTFRWKELSEGSYEIPAFGKKLTISQKGQSFTADCSEEEWDGIWASYFDMQTDYGAIGRRISESGDEYLIAAYKKGSGIRVLRQDLWEMIVTFMISQNNNIPRIRGSVEKICSRCACGDSFPDFYAIDPQIFEDASLGLGYRAGYLRDLCLYARENPGFLDELRRMDHEEAKRFLMSFKGIGEKVANCVLLFGLHHIDAFPVDTHIKKILAEHYPDGFDLEKYRGCAGIVQQYMFYDDLKVK